MKNAWGREESYRWPSNRPVWTITVFMLSALAMLGAGVYQYKQQWTFLQQEYLKTYIASGARPWLKTSSYLLLYRVEGNRERLVVDADLSDPMVLQRKVKLQWKWSSSKSADLHCWLEETIYGGESPWQKLWGWMWKAGAGVLALGLLFAIPRDSRRQRIRKYGRRTKGPELVTAARFNRRKPRSAQGVGFITRERRTFGEWMLGCEGSMVRVPRERESSHFMMMGDTGAGKSSLIRQMLMQVEERGETAIVYDPALEYTPQFYEPDRGDMVLNPVDARMPYWSPCDEVRHEAEAEGLAAALFKDDHRTNPFFVMVPRQIFAHLLIEQKRTPQELLAILRDEQELAKRLKDTEHAAAIYPDAGPQRGGMIATLNSVANALKVLPRKEETKTSWTALEWAQKRQGWLFITSPPEFREGCGLSLACG